MSKWKERIPEGWKWHGMRWKGPKEFPVFVFKNIHTGFTKGFSAWVVQPPTRDVAVDLLIEYVKKEYNGF